MKTTTMTLLFAALVPAAASAYKTAGDGTTYTLEKLAQTAGTEIEKYVDEDDGEVIYSIYASDTIAAGDRFVMDDGVTLLFDDNVALVIEGEADFRLQQGSVFDSAFDDADYVSPVGIVIAGSQSSTAFANCQFYRVGLKSASAKGISVSDCAFYYHNAATGPAALYFVTAGALNTVTNSQFEYCRRAAIGSPANASVAMRISDCTFTANSQDNKNVPQINVTAADSVVIDHCTLTGDPQLNMVGGIGVSNFAGFTDTRTVIRRCHVSDHRYGLTTFGPTNVWIEDNVLTDNCHEQNPMNGGSGISLYDPYQQTVARITGNHIEGSLWGITVIGCKDVNAGHTDVEVDDPNYNPGGNTFVRNGFDGQLYDLYNNSSNTVYAQGNTWNVSEQTEELIETVIFHQHDDPKLGQVIFMTAPTAIAATPADMPDTQSAPIYSLQGQRLASAPRSGIYLRNGRKVAATKH